MELGEGGLEFAIFKHTIEVLGKAGEFTYFPCSLFPSSSLLRSFA